VSPLSQAPLVLSSDGEGAIAEAKKALNQQQQIAAFCRETLQPSISNHRSRLVVTPKNWECIPGASTPHFNREITDPSKRLMLG
jgi:hypothetical protein